MRNTVPNQSNPLIAALADHFASRTPDQRRQGLIDAGILTKKGNVAKAYRSVIHTDSRGRKTSSLTGKENTR